MYHKEMTIRKLLDTIKVFYYEFRSYFVVQKTAYKIEGECIKCGKCCKYMYSFDTYSENEFKIMQRIYPKYRRFKIIGKDEKENLIFACRFVSENGLCKDYENRLNMCRSYPAKKIYYNGKLHDGCGYKVLAEKKFNDFLVTK